MCKSFSGTSLLDGGVRVACASLSRISLLDGGVYGWSVKGISLCKCLFYTSMNPRPPSSKLT